MRKILVVLTGLTLSTGHLFADEDCFNPCDNECYDSYDTFNCNACGPCATQSSDDLFWDLCNSCGCAFASPWPSSINLDAGIGFRRDKLEWSIAGLFNYPNVLSELEWQDLRIIQYQAAASYVSCTNYAIKVYGDYGNIYHGRNIDSDYALNDEEGLYSRSRNNAGKGHVWDVSGAVGYRVTSSCARFVATPYIGYGYSSQYLHMYDGNQTFSLNPFELGPFPGLDSSYTAHWSGGWAGMDFTAQVEKCAFVFGSFEWHQLHYRGKGCWNLRSDIGPFYHKAHGFGYYATLGGNWEIWRNWGIGVVGTYRNYRTRSGWERLTVNDLLIGPVRIKTKFNGAKWSSWGITGIVTYRF